MIPPEENQQVSGENDTHNIPHDVEMAGNQDIANIEEGTRSGPISSSSVGGQQRVSVPQQQPALLAWALFTACDTCIYCGGKFIG
jgi:hypothetical protein